MAEHPTDLADVPEAAPHRQRRESWRLPLVWIVPLVAAIIGGWMAVHAILERGPVITIAFADAEGVEAGKTKVRFKSVDVGIVRRVSLAADHRTVKLLVDMDKSTAPFLVRDTRFWIVRPRLGASGVSGLGTLFSGAYVAADLGDSKEGAREFTGLETPPIVTKDTQGTQFVLVADDVGSLSVGAPAYLRHIEVGQVSAVSLNPDGRGVSMTLFVNAPYDRFITEDTRFWQASGVDVVVDTSGVRVETESLSTILAGGIALETPSDSTTTAPASGGTAFRLMRDRAAAMKSPDRLVETYVLGFDESLRGLAPGAVVDFRGVEIGEVVRVNVEYDPKTHKFVFPVLINVYPERFRSRYTEGTARPERKSHELIASMIEEGLRAQLRTSSLLTGRLYIAIDFFPKAARIAAQPELTPMPLPTIPGNLEEIQNTIVSIAHKLDAIPLDRIGRQTQTALKDLSGTLGSVDRLASNFDAQVTPEARAALVQATLTLASTRDAVAPDAALQNDLHSTLNSIGRAADSVKTLADYLDQHPEALIRGKAKD